MIQELRTILSDTLLSWAIKAAPKDMQPRLARIVRYYLSEELTKRKQTNVTK